MAFTWSYLFFCASLSPKQEPSLPRDTVAVSKAKDRHFTLYEKIAHEHAQIAAQREAERIAFEATSEVNGLH